jgi:hypothetical protein
MEYRMKRLAITIAALLMAIQPLFADEGFTNIDLAAAANYRINAVKKYPTGHVLFKGVPFSLSATRMGLQTEGELAPGPTSFEIPVKVDRPTAVYILLSGTYVKTEFKGKQVGEIILEFTGGEKLTFPITAWETLRETWAYDSDIQQPDSQGNPKLVNVYKERQIRAGKPATAFLDMYVIELERPKLGAELTTITVLDTSRETVDSKAPALIVTGITVKRE